MTGSGSGSGSGSGGNIWDAAIAFDKRRREDPTNSSLNRETTLLLVGSKGVGKTTLVHRFLERQETAKPTLALEYTYGRKTNQNFAKDVAHIWELGGDTLFTGLLETPLAPSKLERLHVVVLVDLSEPHQLWFTLETLLQSLQTHLQRALALAAKSGKDGTAGEKGLYSTLEERLGRAREAREDAEHPDKGRVQSFPVPLVILGGKYDLFQELEPEKKKIVCRSLRFLAHYHGATLQFYSAKDTGSVKKARDLLSHHAFSTEANKGVSQDYNKPLIIPAWSDSFGAITGGDDKATLDMMKHHYTTHFPQSVDERSALPEDPAKDPNFREPQIDQLRAQKDEDLERYRKDIERRARQWGDDFEQSMK